jgi:hypothetical protein
MGDTGRGVLAFCQRQVNLSNFVAGNKKTKERPTMRTLLVIECPVALRTGLPLHRRRSLIFSGIPMGFSGAGIDSG